MPSPNCFCYNILFFNFMSAFNRYLAFMLICLFLELWTALFLVFLASCMYTVPVLSNFYFLLSLHGLPHHGVTAVASAAHRRSSVLLQVSLRTLLLLPSSFFCTSFFPKWNVSLLEMSNAVTCRFERIFQLCLYFKWRCPRCEHTSCLTLENFMSEWKFLLASIISLCSSFCSLFVTPTIYWYGSLFCWSSLKYQFLLEINQGLSLISQVEQCNCKGEFLTASTGTGNALSACFISCPFSWRQRTRRPYTTQIMFVSSKINFWLSCWDSWLPTQSLVGATWQFQV